jgi:simple sugar transport system ATP-binding protein
MQRSNAVELKDIRKAFGTCVSNDGVCLRVAAGSIHAIVGENGAGKSTAMKILYGQYFPDEGEVIVNGEARHWRSSADAIDAGLGMVHQHFMLAETHTALENILLGTHRLGQLTLGASAAEQKLNGIMKEFGLEVPLHAKVETLPVGVQQRIEILKLLYRDSNVLILDEPTAVLAPEEIDGLFRVLRRMAAGGKTILIITHKLKEVMALAEQVTVFRAGRTVAEREVKDTSLRELASLMVGREIKGDSEGERSAPGHDVVLEARAVRPRAKGTRLEEVSFRIRAGEILGVAGVEGNGQSELLQILLHPAEELGEGNLVYRGEDISRVGSIRDRAAAVFPEDRLKEALLLNFSVEENFLLGRQRDNKFRRGPFLRRSAIHQSAASAVKHYDVRPGRLDVTAGSLSGGNQQKLVVARELEVEPGLLLASQPTRGVDIGAIEFIHGKIMELRQRGAGVLLISSELDEVLKLSDRLLVMYRGRVVGSFARNEFDEKMISRLMAGGQAERSHA